jgi:hypothetical protein
MRDKGNQSLSVVLELCTFGCTRLDTLTQFVLRECKPFGKASA